MAATQGKPDPSETLHGGAAVEWNGDLKGGRGSLRFQLGAGGELALLWPGSASYGPGATSPEELAAAAHAACFTMTLAHTLARRGHAPRRITAAAKATFGIVGDMRLIQRSELDVAVDADGLGEADLSHAAELAGRYCPVSNTLRLAGTELAVSTRVAGG